MPPTALLIDTDIYADVDDVGALAVANVLHSAGAAELRGVAVDTPSRHGALAVSAINTYFGHGDDVVAVAARRPLTDAVFADTWRHEHGEYAARVAAAFPHSLADAETAPTPVALFRRELAAAQADNRRLTIVCLGFLVNIADLLDSPPDAVSPLAGPDLVAAAVGELVVMGGCYEDSDSSIPREFNFAGSANTLIGIPDYGGDGAPGAAAAATQRVVNHVGNRAAGGWPASVPITYVGFELGLAVVAGQTLAVDAPADSPVLAAYRWYVGGGATGRESWDPITVLYAVLGLGGRRGGESEKTAAPPLFAYANTHGYNTVDATGANRWVDDPAVTNQHWLRLADGVTGADVVRELDRYLASGPGKV